jgi:hypothetical protein
MGKKCNHSIIRDIAIGAFMATEVAQRPYKNRYMVKAGHK